MKCKNNLHKLNYYLIITDLFLCLNLCLHLSSYLNQLQEATVWRWPGNLLRLPQQPAPPPPRLSWRFGCRLTSSLSLHSNPATEVFGMKSRYYKGGHWCNQKISKITVYLLYFNNHNRSWVVAKLLLKSNTVTTQMLILILETKKADRNKKCLLKSLQYR